MHLTGRPTLFFNQLSSAPRCSTRKLMDKIKISQTSHSLTIKENFIVNTVSFTNLIIKLIMAMINNFCQPV